MENEENKCVTCSAAGSDSCTGCSGKANDEAGQADEAEKINNELKGLDYLTRLSYACVDRSDMTYKKKRNLLFSLYSFRCLFDSSELHRPSKALVKYGCSFIESDMTEKENEHVYEITEGDKTVLKFDAGSPLWKKQVRAKKITGENAVVPEKLTLFEMAYECVTLNTATAELKAMWLIYFPYVFMMNAPVEYDIYDALKSVVHTAEVFSAANAGSYADNICCTVAELTGEHPFIIDWYRPFIEWKCEKNEKGISHETAKYQRALAMGQYAYAVVGTEKLLDAFPDDEEILLLNISARISLAPQVDLERRVKLLSDSFRIINDAFKLPLKKYTYFLYYRGLTQLGMSNPEAAEADFKACLETDPHFELAALMLKGLEKADELSGNDAPKS